MPDATTIEMFSKATNTKEDVKKLQQENLDGGAKSCELTEDATNWILTTVLAGDC